MPLFNWGRSSRRHSDAKGMNGAEGGLRGTDQDFRVRRPDGSVAEAHSLEDDNQPSANGANGKAAPVEVADSPPQADNAPPHHLRRDS